MKVKLGDFGLSTKLSDSQNKTNVVCGTPNYIAPEILNGSFYGPAVDIWSLGVLMYTMLVGIPPFETTNIKETYEKIKKREFKYPNDLSLSVHTINLIDSCLDLNPETRITCDQILNHPFFTSYHIPEEMHIEYQGNNIQLVTRSTEESKKRSSACLTDISNVDKQSKRRMHDENAENKENGVYIPVEKKMLEKLISPLTPTKKSVAHH